MIKKYHVKPIAYWIIYIALTFAFVEGSTEESSHEEKQSIIVDPVKDAHEFSETTHKITINGKKFPYKAVAGTLVLKDAENKSKAKIFFVSYSKDGVENQSSRPITFCFNGGPGSSSVWLHLGGFGPKRVKLTDQGEPVLPYQLSDNEYTLLEATDLVFIDPVSTGFSRTVPGESPKQYHGVDEDIKSIAEFIRLYTTHFSRWESPKFIAGESYGTTRAAKLALYLHDETKMYLNGLILVSSVLHFQSIDFSTNNDLPYIVFLPSYTAAAWYHKRLPQNLQDKSLDDVVAEVEKFALNDYSLAILKGDLLDKEKKDQVVEKLAYYTGLSSKYIEKNNLRVSLYRFVKELLNDDSLTIGRFDARFKGMDIDPVSNSMEYDPSTDVVFGVFTATFNEYVRRQLKWERDDSYYILANVWPWNYGNATNQYLNVSDALKEVMVRNTRLRVFVANGMYDLATPYFATEYTFNHMNLAPFLKDHVKMQYYDAGHMMYIHYPSLIKLTGDLKEFIQQTIDEQAKATSP